MPDELTYREWQEERRARYDMPFSKLFDIGALNDIELEALLLDVDGLIEKVKYEKYGHRPDYCAICNDAPCKEPPRNG